MLLHPPLVSHEPNVVLRSPSTCSMGRRYSSLTGLQLAYPEKVNLPYIYIYIYDNLDDCTNPTLNRLRRFGWTIRPIGIPPKKTLQNTRRGTGIWHRPWRIKGFVKDSLRDVKGVMFCQGIINWKWFIGLILKALTEWASSNMDFGLQCTRTWVLSDSQLFNP